MRECRILEKYMCDWLLVLYEFGWFGFWENLQVSKAEKLGTIIFGHILVVLDKQNQMRWSFLQL